jgi:hypothetical protein
MDARDASYYIHKNHKKGSLMGDIKKIFKENNPLHIAFIEI